VRCRCRVIFILTCRDESLMNATFAQYLGLIHSRAPTNGGAAQVPASAGNIRGMGVGAEWASDRSQTEHHDERQRVTVSEAADIFGITAEAVRTRIKRGKLDSVMDPPRPGGTVYVLLEADQTRPNIDPISQGQDQTTVQTPPDAAERFAKAMIEELRDRVRYLERVLEEEREARTDERRRHETLMAQLMQRIPELEAPSEARESPESPGPTRVPLPTPAKARRRPERSLSRKRSRTDGHGGVGC
jgi:hypothetical protein